MLRQQLMQTLCECENIRTDEEIKEPVTCQFKHDLGQRASGAFVSSISRILSNHRLNAFRRIANVPFGTPDPLPYSVGKSRKGTWTVGCSLTRIVANQDICVRLVPILHFSTEVAERLKVNFIHIVLSENLTLWRITCVFKGCAPKICCHSISLI